MIRSLLILICILPGGTHAASADESSIEFFEKKIRPALITYCYECHSAAAAEPGGGLLLDSRPSIRRGGESGPAVVPFHVDQSLLVQAIRHESLQMPPKKKLDDATIAAFVTWIQLGAADTRDQAADAHTVAQKIQEQAFETRRQWWSFQPLKIVTPPKTHVDDQHHRWQHSPIDRFLLRKLQQHSLEPAVRADRQVLVRRLAYTLTGLPPSMEDVTAFTTNERTDAWEQLIQKYLSSEHFGERFARHWMDVVRYTDTYGYEWDVPARGAWRYRDYLIRAFNADVPFDQLIREQLAGDLLEKPRVNDQLQLNESAIGPMFYHLGEHRHGDSLSFEGIHQEMIDNKIDAFSKAFQGITIACARCHDHKLDPISQQEYYALAGVFMSARWIASTVDLPNRQADTLTRLRRLKAELRHAVADVWVKDLQQNMTPATLDAIQPPTPLPIGDINHPWHEIHKLPDEALARQWTELRQTIAEADAEAKAFNDASFTLLADFGQGIPDDWTTDGPGLEVVRSGDFQVQSGDTFIQSVFLPGVATSGLSSRLNGALRSPLLHDIRHPHVAILAAGNDLSAFRRVIDNAFLCEKQTYYANSAYHWKVESTFSDQPQRRIYFEFATKTSNPNFPPRWGLGTKLTDEMIADPNSWFAVSQVFGSQKAVVPKQRLTAFLKLLESGTPASKAEAANLYQRWLVDIVQSWRDGKSTPEQIQVLNNLLQTSWVTKSAGHPELQALVQQYRECESKLQSPRTVNSMVDCDPGVNYRLNVRGSYYELGDAVPRGYLRLLTSDDEESATFTSSGSGRLELAQRVASSDNPLTARVYVNRIWQWLFGQGLVDTPSNFGKLGGTPSHPELLDWLAARFVEHGWSTKTLVREILLTQAWQQSGVTAPAAVDADPENRLLHHFSTRRLEAECIGDAMLAVSGRLNRSLYGPPHNPYRTSEDEMKRLFSGPLDGNGRRMIYTKVTIMEPARFLATFNQPDPKLPTGRRDLTNTPTQALTLLNDPFVKDVACYWGNAIVADESPTSACRLESMLSRAFSRTISAAEMDEWLHALNELARLRNVTQDRIMTDAQLWTDVAHTIFNCKEFIHLR
ncbi:MAG: PSD1 and planctomycete cytochrome C domain-containing protein [Fuerstiella sp.]